MERQWHFPTDLDNSLDSAYSPPASSIFMLPPRLEYTPYSPHLDAHAPLPPLPALPSHANGAGDVESTRSTDSPTPQDVRQRGHDLGAPPPRSDRQYYVGSPRQQHHAYHPYQSSQNYVPSSVYYPPRSQDRSDRQWHAEDSPPAGTTVGDLMLNLPPSGVNQPVPYTSTNPVMNLSTGPPDQTKPFIGILYSILANAEQYRDCLTWDEEGTTFIVSHNDRLINEIMPRYFQHSNLQSFTRQLNVYEFTRLTTPQMIEKLDITGPANTTLYSGWTHINFQRDDRSLLAKMKPRPSKARLLKKAEKQAVLDAERRKVANGL